MDFQHEPGRYFLQAGDKTLAQITYSTINDGQTFAVNTTNVDPSLRGQGVAAALLDAVVDEARAKGMTVHPICSYARKAFFYNPAKYEEIQYKP
ncbi:N-acetyltransferase [Leuconostoc holzapfelii]|uniref:N-acetyltransferase n=1 Tax=Leuconostoc holzapfelii TaxID=434464 RepID=A0A846ZGL8_9LACO|nr:GNAT family N-acetyltransferase [Leuconostoc holzapfelii]MCT8388902.1 N-acetyltransferase [Leuconostoc holzapfelii]NKZ18405.1 N-acetyltransferase [Leuconostoc holzapfelii]